MKNNLKLLLVVAVTILTVYFSNKYVATINEQKYVFEKQNTLLQEVIEDTKLELLTEVEEILNSDSITHILPKSFIWNDVVVKLEEIETLLEIEINKSYTEVEKDSYLIYGNLDDFIEIHVVEMNFDVNYSDIHMFIKKIQELDQLIIIDSIDYVIVEKGLYSVNMTLLYFNYQE